jgi:amino acid transporter
MALWGSAVVIALLASSERLGSLFIVSSSAVLLQYLSAMASLGRLALRSDSSVSRLWLLPAMASVGAVAFLARAVELREVVMLSFALLLGAVVGIASARATRARAR